MRDDAALLAGQVDAGRLAEAEAPHPLVEALGAEPQPDRDRARRSRTGRGCPTTVSVPPPPPCASLIVAVGHLDRRPERERRARRDEPLLERARDRERLEGRAGLVGEADGAVLARVLGRLADPVRVDARPVRHREHLAVARVHHERGGAARAVELAELGQHGLGALLDRGVDRQPQVLAGLGALDVDDAHRLAGRVLDDLALAVRAVERLLARLLEPAQAVVVGADAAEHLRGERPLRVAAARLDDRADALDLELAGPSRRGSSRACGAGRRSRCRGRRASRAARPAQIPSSGDSLRATPGGSSIRNGLAKTVVASSETASSTPLRSVIVPRRA